ncbi:corrinoid protein [Luteitalea sp.]|uniref:corrinoid protein n=1 Tax=Luteitalea sp. TaxID=2004800 RepID=UPI0025C1EDB5|nr:corrinoid protein [Luteitalea sp.]
MIDLAQLGAAVERGDRDSARSLTQAAIDAGQAPQEILDAMVGAMGVVGRRFQAHEVFVPEMLIAARAMKESIALLEPLLVQAGIRPVARAIIGTVEGDLHDIGKNLVAMMWRSANIEVIDLGANVSPQRFLDAARQHEPHLVGLSALLTTTMPAIRRTVETLRQAGVAAPRIVIGGAPVTLQYAREIGADGYAPDAASAVDLARQLLGLQGSPS